MKRKKRIEKILSDDFKSFIIEVIDISHHHKGHNHFTGNNETHFSIILTLNTNDDFKRIDIHRKINYLLKDEFSSGLHALEIKIKN
tara:strand:+ start:453 stop:710 length:258 start_codon:yes stop_codon:yes gene_type:complete